MTPQEIAARLTALDTAIIEKTGERPFIGACLGVDDRGRVMVSLYRGRSGGSYDLGTSKGVTFAEALDDADRIVAALPDPAEAVIHEYLSRVAKAVDYATENSIDDEYVAPLRGVSKAMTGNLLTKEAAQ